MQCQWCGKSHPPENVTWAEGNKAKQPRPYHCPKCREANRGDKIPDNWKTGTIAEAEACRKHGRHRPAPGGCCL